MKIFQKVRSTAKQVPYVEVNKDTVYVRNDIERVEEVDFSGWEYNEVQYGLQEYIEKLTTNSHTDAMALLLSMMMSEIDFLKDRLKALEGGVK